MKREFLLRSECVMNEYKTVLEQISLVEQQPFSKATFQSGAIQWGNASEWTRDEVHKWLVMRCQDPSEYKAANVLMDPVYVNYAECFSFPTRIDKLACAENVKRSHLDKPWIDYPTYGAFRLSKTKHQRGYEAFLKVVDFGEIVCGPRSQNCPAVTYSRP